MGSGRRGGKKCRNDRKKRKGRADGLGQAVLLFPAGVLLLIVLIAEYPWIGVLLAAAACGWVWLRVRRGLVEQRKLRALELSDVDAMDGLQFERYVAALLSHRGFRTELTRASGDLGVDIVAFRGREKVAVQVKRKRGKVGRDAVSDAVAGKGYYRCGDAMVVTNGFFTPGAVELAEATGCALVDRDELAGWVVDFQRGTRKGAQRAG